MTKLVYDNNWEKGKWKFTQWFIDNYVTDEDIVLETHAGLGNITQMYANKYCTVCSCEIDKDTYQKLFNRFMGYPNVTTLLLNSLEWLTNMIDKYSFFNIIDLDPWGNANLHIQEVLRVMPKGYLIFTSGEPYMITRFKGKITKYGGEPITDWREFPEILFNRFIDREARKFNKEARLIDYYSSPRICRVLVEIK